MRERLEMTIDWLSMSAAEQLAAIQSAPPIAGPWESTNDAGGGFKYYEEPGCVWFRHKMYPGFSTGIASVQPHIGCPGWGAEVLNKHVFHCPTAEDAKVAADRVLTESGWRLL